MKHKNELRFIVYTCTTYLNIRVTALVFSISQATQRTWQPLWTLSSALTKTVAIQLDNKGGLVYLLLNSIFTGCRSD